MRRFEPPGNQFIVTSRIAGYRSSPLTAPFVHYVVQEMDQAEITRFLERWCRAVEDAETPDAPPDQRDSVARREIEAILDAIRTSPGVARLAANPLLLRVLALIHRTGAPLPQKRIRFYKLAADTLARTWRTAMGVPETALVHEKNLTRLLGSLAFWMHSNKPTGLATQSEVHAVLGEEWARMEQKEWDPDDPDDSVHHEVEKFLLTVRIQTGLFVERAPNRYGFMHLTFEEYFASRHLVRLRRSAPKVIRERLHDPRWAEPILLALGFYGLDLPDGPAS